ncbi:MAG: metallophosphoesterase [Deltaproteobacteria bacterium]|nr:MAG: metallophosphoesterase [Deltaproteobacteria bacterium]
MKRRLFLFAAALPLILATAAQAQQITRGPYLQQGTAHRMIVRWRTDIPTDSRVDYGLSAGDLSEREMVGTPTTEHEIVLSGLTPETRYYYAVGTGEAILAGGPDFSFVTAPLPGTPRPIRIWAIGDAGTANDNQRAVRDAYVAFTGQRHTDLWLMLGDNAYDDGTDAQYQAAVFEIYPALLRTSAVWPTFGNHDSHASSALAQRGPYFEIFTLPTRGEAGGVASGTEAYYAFDYANVHFVCLDSSETAYVPGANTTMLEWLTEDLRATDQRWIIAFWHHPPYSKGSHDSDLDPTLAQIRHSFLPILEDAGVDLVLSGHSHSYERSFLLDGHYGNSETLDASMILDAGNGRPEEEGSYKKPTDGIAPHEGAVYVVAGSSGKTSDGKFDHEAMYVSLEELGSLVIDVAGSVLTATFLDDHGDIRDTFTIEKGTERLTAPEGLSATFTGEAVELTWQDRSSNETFFKIERSRDDNRWGVIALADADATHFVDSAVETGETYFYRIRAGSDTGNSPYSGIVTVETGRGSPCGFVSDPRVGGSALLLALALLLLLATALRRRLLLP